MPGKNLRIAHTQVGPWLEGRVVSYADFEKLGDDVDVDRLLQLEAVVETDEELTKTPAPLNPHNMPKVDSAGRVVDLRGQDRPTAGGMLPPGLQRARRAEVREKAGLPEDVNASSHDEDGNTLEGEAIDANDAADEADAEAARAAAAQPGPSTVAPIGAPVARRPVAAVRAPAARQPVTRQPVRRPAAGQQQQTGEGQQ
jgi:hypothetical protein